MQKFEYVIGKGDEIFYEFQPRDDNKLKETIHQFVNWLKINNLYEVYQQNYSTTRYEKEIGEFLCVLH
jgi:hypothetical protein